MNKVLENWSHEWFGFWRNDHHPNSPAPEDCVCSELPVDFEEILKYLSEQSVAGFITGTTIKCQLCFKELPLGWDFDGQFAWPISLVHYIKYHSVWIPARFIERIRNLDYKAPNRNDYLKASGKTGISLGDLPMPNRN